MDKRRIKKMSELDNLEGLIGGISEEFKMWGIYGDNDSGDKMEYNINDLSLEELYNTLSGIYNANLKYDEALKMKAFKVIKNYIYKINNPNNKFEVGNKVLYKTLDENYKEVEYRGEDSKGNPIVEFKSGSVKGTERDKIFPIKKRSSLEPGDKFKAMDSTFEVIAVGEDSIIGTVYFSKSLGMETMYYIICWEKIDKIIY